MLYRSIALTGMTLILANCGSDSASNAVVALTDMSAIPKITSAVASSSTASYRDAYASNGVKFNALSSVSSWGSRAMCETSQVAREILREASRPDKLLCYIGKMEEEGLFTDSYDGTNKYYKIGTDLFVRFKATKNSEGGISTFEMFECENSASPTSNSDNGAYKSYSISSDGTVSVTSVGAREDSNFSSNYRVTVTGKVNSSGAWTEKVITYDGTWSGSGGNSGNNEATLTQYADRMVLSGYNNGSFNSGSFTNQVYAVFGLLGASKLTTIAMGDGSSKGAFIFGGVTVPEATFHWTGDDQANASTSSHATEVSEGSLPQVSSPSVSFETSETWNCQAEGSFTEIAESSIPQAGITACDEIYRLGGSNDNDFISCQ